MKNRDKESILLFKVFLRIAHDWNLTEKEQLDLLNVKSMKILRDFESGNIVLQEELSRRIGYLMNIQQALKVLLPDTHAANTWIRRENSAPMFNGRPAINLMIFDESFIRKVRDYLFSQLV